jgi:flagella basal body P-ring formation protein FlgA
LSLRHSLGRGELITARDVEPVWIDVTHRAALPLLTELESDGALSMKRQAVAGTPLTTLIVEETPLVRRGDVVTLVYVRNGLSIRMEAVAQSSGAYGEEVEVRSSASRQTVTGIVTDEGVVEK